jgi:Protein of unknown function (DUF4446)
MDIAVISGLAGAGALGLAALVISIVNWVRVHRLRAAQSILMTDGVAVSLVDAQAVLRGEIADVRTALKDLEALMERQGGITERELSRALRFQGMVRYDAYRDMGGQQSWSIALLDQSRTGNIITSLHSRDHARVYLKELVDGVCNQRLSPEEERAIALAMGPRSARPTPVPPPTASPDQAQAS